ncbi:MAG: hypothetical protein NZM00_13925, partial [Anaerolinea sp.]|nr:hypothetical protein [Anaerolinea sp.]
SSEALILSLIMMAISIVVVALPLLRRSQLEQQRARESEQLKLLAAYERALVTVRDLDEDYSIGKLPEDQYRVERATWLERGAAILEMLEQYADVGHQRRMRPIEAKTPAAPADDAIESAIAAYIKAREQSQKPQLEKAQ